MAGWTYIQGPGCGGGRSPSFFVREATFYETGISPLLPSVPSTEQPARAICSPIPDLLRRPSLDSRSRLGKICDKPISIITHSHTTISHTATPRIRNLSAMENKIRNLSRTRGKMRNLND